VLSAPTHNYITDGTTPASSVLSDGSAVYTPGISENRSGTSAFYHTDAIGSTRDITNSSQTVTDTRRFDAFGMLAETSGSNPTPFGFVAAGQYQTDTDSGLMLLGHRYYDSSIGRFISRDPAYAGTNWYAYTGNNPLSRIDPAGASWVSTVIGIAVGVVVTVVTLDPVLGVAAGIGTGTLVSHFGEHNSWDDSLGDGVLSGIGTLELAPLAIGASMMIGNGGGSGSNTGSGTTSGGGGATTDLPDCMEIAQQTVKSLGGGTIKNIKPVGGFLRPQVPIQEGVSRVPPPWIVHQVVEHGGMIHDPVLSPTPVPVDEYWPNYWGHQPIEVFP
jgi:RHS repeat-associated protein